MDYDLSKVLFITTANVKYDIPLPLLDRMEVIELSSYLEDAKVEIAERHILPKIIKEFALDNVQLDFTREAIIKVIQEHTREAGVRNLERELSSVLRKLAREIITQSTTQNKKSKKMVKNKKEVVTEKKAVVYQVFTRLFGNKNTTNNTGFILFSIS